MSHHNETRGYFSIVETDNFDSDYPFEKWALNGALRLLTWEEAEAIVNTINKVARESLRRYWKVVKDGYVLDNFGPDGERYE